MKFHQKSLNWVLVFFFCIILFVGKLHAQQGNVRKLSKSFVNAPIGEVFAEVESYFGVSIYYEEEWFSGHTIDKHFKEANLDRVLYDLFFGTAYSYTIIQESHVVLLPRDDVALYKGKLVNYSNNIYQSQIIDIGDPSEAGKYEKIHLSGVVKEGKTSEPLIGSTVWIENTNIAVVTGLNGKYDLELKPGLYTVQYSSMGFEKTSFNIKIISNGTLDIELFEESHQIGEVAIYAIDAERNVRSTQMSMVELNAKAIKQLPALTGEIDVIKSFTMMPGVHSVGEFGSGLNVRGGGEDQNLYLLEGTPVYNTSHVFGMLSVLNPDFVKEVQLYKGHIPSEFGERVSSVMDIKGQSNGVEKFGGKGGIGIYNSRLMFHLPLFNKKVTLKIGGRGSYSDYLLKQVGDYNMRRSAVDFYDINASLNIDLDKNKISLFGYTSYDYFKYADQYSYAYGNNLGSLNWSSYHTSNLSTRLRLAYSRYDVERNEMNYLPKAKTTNNSVEYKSAKYSALYSGITGHTLEGGLQYIQYQIQPGERNPYGDLSVIEVESLLGEQSREMAVFVNDKFDIGEKVSFNLGLRYTHYQYYGAQSVYEYTEGVPLTSTAIVDSNNYDKGTIISQYGGLEPRLSMKVQVTDESSVKLSYNKNQQFISLISNTSISTPEDIWKLSDKYIKPIIANQLAAGYYRNFRNNTYETSVEVYYKKLDNLLEYKNDAKTEMSPHIETEVIPTEGNNYGVELMVKKNAGKLEGWLSYTYSRAMRKSNGQFKEEMINDNTWFPSSFDKPHNLSIVTTYHHNKRLRFTGTFNYSSGRAVTLPEYQFKSGGQVLIYYSDRNKYRLPQYHRLDLAVSYDESLKRHKKWKGSWTLSIINVYGRKNAHSVYYRKQTPTFENDYKMYSLYKMAIIGIPLPTLTYNFIF